MSLTLAFDTGIVIALARRDAVGSAVVNHFPLRQTPQKPLVSVVSVGECLAIAKRDNWGSPKIEKLRELLSAFTVVDLSAPKVLDAYAAISSELELSGKLINQNDMWIAAGASAFGARLVTTDGDFDRLVPKFLQRTQFQSRTGTLLSE